MGAKNIFMETTQTPTLSELYSQYYSRLYKYTLFRIGDICAAEDLVSGIFEKLILKYNGYDAARGKLNTWLYSIVNNAIINYYKDKDNSLEPIDLVKSDSNYRLEDLVADRELKEFLLKAIMLLDERQKNIIALKFGARQTNRQIAGLLNLTESNVGTILYRALKKLKGILQEQGFTY